MLINENSLVVFISNSLSNIYYEIIFKMSHSENK